MIKSPSPNPLLPKSRTTGSGSHFASGKPITPIYLRASAMEMVMHTLFQAVGERSVDWIVFCCSRRRNDRHCLLRVYNSCAQRKPLRTRADSASSHRDGAESRKATRPATGKSSSALKRHAAGVQTVVSLTSGCLLLFLSPSRLAELITDDNQSFGLWRSFHDS